MATLPMPQISPAGSKADTRTPTCKDGLNHPCTNLHTCIVTKVNRIRHRTTSTKYANGYCPRHLHAVMSSVIKPKNELSRERPANCQAKPINIKPRSDFSPCHIDVQTNRYTTKYVSKKSLNVLGGSWMYLSIPS